MKKLLLILLLIILATIVYFLRGSEVTYNLDTYVYELPFKEGTGHKVVQGYGGRFSHTNKAAIDFAMPVGTPVYAAREGTIYSYKDIATKAGFLPVKERQTISSSGTAMEVLVATGI